MSEIKWKIEKEDIEWEMDWDTYQAPGQKGKEMIFEPDKALAILLINDVIYSNSFWNERTWPEEAKKRIALYVDCSDTFQYSCSDLEPLPFSEIENLYRFWEKDPEYGPTAWCITQRKQMPIRCVADKMKERGYDLDKLIDQGEHPAG